MRYFDSLKRQFVNTEAQAVYERMVSDPRFRFKYRGLRQGAGQKAFPSYPILGPNGLDFAICEWTEMGYGIFDGYTDGEQLLSFLGPIFMIDQEKIEFRVTDWRARMAHSRGSNNDWTTCNPITATDVQLDGCVFNYCFDWDRYNYVSVPAGVKPSDLAIPCLPQYPINVFGQSITDPIALRDWELYAKGRIHMLQRLVNGDWAATTTGDAYQEDGILKFFDNWTERQAATVTGYCLTEFAPVTVPVTGADTAAKWAMFIASVSGQFADIEYRARMLDGQARIDPGNVAIVMNEQDALCTAYYQACTTKCGTVFNVNNPSDIQSWWDYLQSRFVGGLYGGGTLRMSDGRELSIMQNHMVPQGTVVMLINGWSGGRPNPYGMRYAAMQYGEYYRRLVATAPQAQLRYRIAMNGAWLEEMPTTGCGDKSIRWNGRLITNAAWMQRKWTGLPLCSDLAGTFTDWPTLPDLPSYSRCVPPTGDAE